MKKKLSSNLTYQRNRCPTHPGIILREDVMPELGISQTELALRLGVSRRTISEILNQQRPVTVDMAIRLAYFLGGTPNSWLNMQQALDIWELEHKNAKLYKKIKKIDKQIEQELTVLEKENDYIPFKIENYIDNLT